MTDIVYAHEDFYLCYKDEGTDFHDSDDGPGFFSLLKERFPRETLYPVHRLDKPTSGLILAARSKEAAAGLTELLSSGGMEKIYMAVSAGKPKKKRGWVIGDMERSRRGQWKLLRSRENPARSYFLSRSQGEGKRLFLIRIYTGKTHQIRVALKSLGAPVWGDPLYNAASLGQEDFSVEDRCYLHAWSLGFRWKDQDLNFRCLPRSGRCFPREGETLDPGLKEFLEGASFPVFP